MRQIKKKILHWFDLKLPAQSIRKTYKFSSKIGIFILFLILGLVNCQIGSGPAGVFQLRSRFLSLNNPELRTCIFDPYYSIVHFPMYHFPAEGNYSSQDKELTVHSQFQLLHTIIDYKRSGRAFFVFEEQAITDYTPAYYQNLLSGQIRGEYTRMDGQIFHLNERIQTAKNLFRNGFPNYYEYLSPQQKDYLFNMGASFTLYFLGEIPQIHKVISREKFKLAEANLRDSSGRIRKNNYWIYNFRELELRNEVLNFRRNHGSQGIIFIAYGASHNLYDEFAGFPFQSSHNFCLNWLEGLGFLKPLS